MSAGVTQSIETEIKLSIPGGAAEALRLLERHGCRPLAPRVLQIDQTFDLPGRLLTGAGKLLRLRLEDGRGTLTFKGPPLPGRYKSREELELAVSDPAVFASILDRLGYVPAFRYEKYRTTFSAGNGGILALDETPIGVFLELEGLEDWIESTAVRLGFTPPQYITASYASLYAAYRRSHQAPLDMLFRTSGEKEP